MRRLQAVLLGAIRFVNIGQLPHGVGSGVEVTYSIRLPENVLARPAGQLLIELTSTAPRHSGDPRLLAGCPIR